MHKTVLISIVFEHANRNRKLLNNFKEKMSTKRVFKFENNPEDKCLPYTFDLPMNRLRFINNMEGLKSMRSWVKGRRGPEEIYL